jgi:hypothetical protein
MVLAGTDDLTQDYDGAMGDNFRLMSVPETLEFWRQLRGCTVANWLQIPPHEPEDPTAAVRVDWTAAKTCRRCASGASRAADTGCRLSRRSRSVSGSVGTAAAAKRSKRRRKCGRSSQRLEPSDPIAQQAAFHSDLLEAPRLESPNLYWGSRTMRQAKLARSKGCKSRPDRAYPNGTTTGRCPSSQSRTATQWGTFHRLVKLLLAAGVMKT